MKQFFLLGMTLLTLSAYSSDKGNGGSGEESSIAARQAVLEGTALKIKKFFSVNGASLQGEFPEFRVQDLVTIIDRSNVRVVDVKDLKDKHGKSRSCLNYPESGLIECKYSDIERLESNPQALFVLTFHEYLGLLGVEETSPLDSSFIDGYSISKRLAAYVSKVNDYDLVLEKKNKHVVQTTQSNGIDLAARACAARATTSTIAGCISVVNHAHYFDKNAVRACKSEATTSTITDCMAAIANKKYIASVAKACQQASTTSTIANCLRSSGTEFRN